MQKNKKFTGEHLQSFKKKHDLSSAELRDCFGIDNPTRMNDILRSDELSVSISILLRVYEENPETIPKKRKYDYSGTLSKLNNILGDDESLSGKEFSIIIGKDVTAMSRSKTRAEKPNATTQRLLSALNIIMDDDAKDTEQRKKQIKKYIKNVIQVGKTRNITNVLKEQKWKTKH